MEDSINSTNVRQEVVPKSLSFMSASNKPSNVVYFQERWNLRGKSQIHTETVSLSNGLNHHFSVNSKQ